MKPLLDTCGEFLELKCRDAELTAFNATTVADALDASASAVERFDDGRIMFVTRYVLRRDRIGKAAAFRLAAIDQSPIFVTVAFVEHWSAAGMKGLKFKAVELQ
jgi:hypothetical protein